VNRDTSGSGHALVRRTRLDGRWRTFVHPGTPPRLDPRGRPLQGQLIGRAVVPADGTRPLHLPLVQAACDARGACCALYHHVPASPEDRERIRGVLGGEDGFDDLFVEAFAGHPGSLNIATVEGRCAFQQPDGLCRVQVLGGPGAKPTSCSVYPAVLVACGEEWHASLRPECACLARHAVEGRMLSEDPQAWADLRARFARVWEVPDVVVIEGDRVLSRGAYVEWMRRSIARLSTSFEPLVALAEAGREIGVETAAPDAAWLDAVARDLAREQREGDIELHPDSPLRATFAWAREVFDALRAGADPEPRWSKGRAADHARRMASLATMTLHGHALLEWRELGPALIDLRRFLWLGRASNAVRPAEDADPRLESLTAWIFLWRLVEWGRAPEPDNP
jgi:hypothetical protein